MTRETQAESHRSPPNRAIVHVVGVVRDDVGERRWIAQAARERAQVSDVPALARLGGDASEVHERVVVADVRPPVAAHVASSRQALEEALPPKPAAAQLARERRAAEPALAVVAGAPVRRSRDHRQVVGEAGCAGT